MSSTPQENIESELFPKAMQIEQRIVRCSDSYVSHCRCTFSPLASIQKYARSVLKGTFARGWCGWNSKKDLRLSTEGRVKYRGELINSDFSFCAFTTASGDNFLLSPVHPDVPALLVINDDKEVSPKGSKFLS